MSRFSKTRFRDSPERRYSCRGCAQVLRIGRDARMRSAESPSKFIAVNSWRSSGRAVVARRTFMNILGCLDRATSSSLPKTRKTSVPVASLQHVAKRAASGSGRKSPDKAGAGNRKIHTAYELHLPSLYSSEFALLQFIHGAGTAALGWCLPAAHFWTA